MPGNLYQIFTEIIKMSLIFSGIHDPAALQLQAAVPFIDTQIPSQFDTATFTTSNRKNKPSNRKHPEK
jgi:hypothetical protein